MWQVIHKYILHSFYSWNHFAKVDGEHHVTLDQISSNLVDFDIATDDATNADTVGLDVATDDADNNNSVGLSADKNDTVCFDVAANDALGPDVVADDAVGLGLAAGGANNDGKIYLNVLPNQSRHIPYEI